MGINTIWFKCRHLLVFILNHFIHQYGKEQKPFSKTFDQELQLLPHLSQASPPRAMASPDLIMAQSRQGWLLWNEAGNTISSSFNFWSFQIIYLLQLILLQFQLTHSPGESFLWERRGLIIYRE